MFLLKKELTGGKRFFLTLQNLFGVGGVYSLYLCSRIGISVKAYIRDVSYKKVRILNRILVSEGVFEIELSRLIRSKIQRKISIRSYEGRRHTMSLPVRGQNTKNNRKTSKKLNKRL